MKLNIYIIKFILTVDKEQVTFSINFFKARLEGIEVDTEAEKDLQDSDVVIYSMVHSLYEISFLGKCMHVLIILLLVC